MEHRKLGKRPPKKDRRTLKLTKFLNLDDLIIPDKVEWSKAVSGFSMMKNDELGNCAIVGLANIIKSWTANERVELTLTDETIVDAYARICGYKPVTDEDDYGCILIEVLNYWRVIGIDGHKIDGYVSLNPKKKKELKAALYLFGGIYLGLQLPAFSEDTDEWNLPRTGDSAEIMPGGWGGHAVVVLDADDEYLTLVSWGRLIKMNWEFLYAYSDEAFAVFDAENWAADGTAPNGFDVESLKESLKRM